MSKIVRLRGAHLRSLHSKAESLFDQTYKDLVVLMDSKKKKEELSDLYLGHNNLWALHQQVCHAICDVFVDESAFFE